MSASVDPAALRAARERAGLTQHQLARLVGVAGVAGGEWVSRWELGTSEPRPEIHFRLAKVLDVAALDLLDLADGADLRALRFATGLPPSQVAAVRTLVIGCRSQQPTTSAPSTERQTHHPGHRRVPHARQRPA